MRLFKKPEAEPETQQATPGPELLTDGPLFASWYLVYRLDEEIERARRYGRPLAVAQALTPSLSGVREDMEALAAATEAAQTVARSTDLLGWIGEDYMLMIMPETTEIDAEAAVSRWQNEMWLRSRSLGGHKWHIKALPDPVQFESAAQFLEATTEAGVKRKAA